MAIFSQALRLCPRVQVLLVFGKERVPPALFQDRTSWSWVSGSGAQKPERELLPGAALGAAAGSERHLAVSLRISTWRLLGGHHLSGDPAGPEGKVGCLRTEWVNDWEGLWETEEEGGENESVTVASTWLCPPSAHPSGSVGPLLLHRTVPSAESSTRHVSAGPRGHPGS